MAKDYVPSRGDIVWINFNPQAGREQAGHRPALVLTEQRYNRRVGLGIFCPLTTKRKGYPFEVAFTSPDGRESVVLADQAKSLDWRRRGISFKHRVDDDVVEQTVAYLVSLLSSGS